MLVYRIEKNGSGPYRYTPTNEEEKYIIESMVEKHSFGEKSVTRPLSWTDVPNGVSLLLSSKEWLCGFKTIEELKVWFEDYLEDLYVIGFNVICYEVPEQYVVYGKHQLLFRKNTLCRQKYRLTKELFAV